jgi:hypothetical protein
VDVVSLLVSALAWHGIIWITWNRQTTNMCEEREQRIKRTALMQSFKAFLNSDDDADAA